MNPLDLPCREYRGILHPYGYGFPTLGEQRYKPNGSKNGRYQVLLHRWVMEKVLGRPLRHDEFVLHLCDNPPCFLFAHLVLADHGENMRQMVERGRSNRGERHWNWQGGHSRNYQEGRNLAHDPVLGIETQTLPGGMKVVVSRDDRIRWPS